MKEMTRDLHIQALLLEKTIGTEKTTNNIFVDVDDHKEISPECLSQFMELKKGMIQTYETKKGYHYYLTTIEPSSPAEVVLLLLKTRADHLFIIRYLLSGTQTLFTIRRNKNNVKKISTEYFD